MNNTTLQSLISDRDRTSKRLTALNNLIEIYGAELNGSKVNRPKGKMSAAQRKAIARGVRRRNRLNKRGNEQMPYPMVEPQPADQPNQIVQ